MVTDGKKSFLLELVRCKKQIFEMHWITACLPPRRWSLGWMDGWSFLILFQLSALEVMKPYETYSTWSRLRLLPSRIEVDRSSSCKAARIATFLRSFNRHCDELLEQ